MTNTDKTMLGAEHRDQSILLAMVILVITLVVLLTVYSCTEHDSAPALRVGSNNIWPGYEPLYLARHLKLYDEGLLDMVEYSSSSQVIRALRNGVIDAAGLTLDEAILLLDQGLAVKILAVMDISNGADAIISRPHITTFSALKTRQIGVENTALGAFFLARALEEHAMSTADVDILPVEIDEQYRAFMEQRVDAVVTFEPVMSKLIQQGGHKLFHSGQIPGEIVDVLVINADYLTRRNQRRVNELLESWYAALEYLKEHPETAAAQISKHLKMSTEDVLASYQGMILPDREQNRQLLISKGQDQPAKLKVTSSKLVDIMYQNRLIEHKIDASRLFLTQEGYLTYP
ncbi:MAG: hypothetical protein EP315_08900 [Gammaproteobacteria bacterium]|nr:MAG: hypothetical protein EP315_08900 [Gammaproteobacteria bacterium]